MSNVFRYVLLLCLCTNAVQSDREMSTDGLQRYVWLLTSQAVGELAVGGMLCSLPFRKRRDAFQDPNFPANKYSLGILHADPCITW